MQNPLLNSVRNIEIACSFKDDILDKATQDRICKFLLVGAEIKFGMPAIRNDNARPDISLSKGTVRLGYFWIEAKFEQSDNGGLLGRLSWGNAKPIRGVAKFKSGDIICLNLSDNTVEGMHKFISKLLETIKINY